MAKIFRIISIAALMLLATVSITQPVFAEETEKACECYCGTDKTGAVSKGGLAESDCRDLCRESSTIYVGCFEKGNDPSKNPRCWSASECTADVVNVPVPGTIGTEEKSSVYAGQSAYCKEGQGYCLNPAIPIDLSVPIGNLTHASSVGEYIEGLYIWLIGAASLIAVLIFMIGGVEYLLARGNTSQVTRAKERMINAVIGIVLLLCSYAIAAFIDPSLVKFKDMQVPKIKTVAFIDGASTCKTLSDIGVRLDPLRGGCGEKSKIPEGGLDYLDDEYKSMDISVEEGDECIWDDCAEGVCMYDSSAAGDYSCKKCEDIYDDGKASGGVDANNTNCARMVPAQPETTGVQNDFYSCKLLKKEYGVSLVSDMCGTFVYPESSSHLDCAQLRAAAGKDNPCEAYEKIIIRMGGDKTEITTFDDGTGNFYVRDYCQKDSQFCRFGINNSGVCTWVEPKIPGDDGSCELQ